MDNKGESHSDGIVTTNVYGIKSRDRATRLIDSLALIPCCPSTIFRVDQFGRLLGVVDMLREERRTYFVRVISWCDGKGPPVIEWSLNPASFGRRLGIKADRAILDFTCGVRVRRPMEVKFSVERHAQLYATTALVAS